MGLNPETLVIVSPICDFVKKRLVDLVASALVMFVGHGLLMRLIGWRQVSLSARLRKLRFIQHRRSRAAFHRNHNHIEILLLYIYGISVYFKLCYLTY